MRRYHAKRSGEVTRYALTQGFSLSFTSKSGDTVSLSRAGRGKPFLITITTVEGTTVEELHELGVARARLDAIKRQWSLKL